MDQPTSFRRQLPLPQFSEAHRPADLLIRKIQASKVIVGLTSFGLLRFTAKGLARRRVRTILTILGLAALILTYVSVQSLVSTLEVNLTGSVGSLGGEIDVWSKGASYPLVSKIPDNYTGIVGSIAGVSLAAPVDLALLTIGSDQALIAGVVPSRIPSLLNYTMVQGSMITSNQSGVLAIGTLLS